MRVQVILNPSAGSGTGARMKEKLAAALKAAGLPFELTETTQRGHALELAAAMRRSGCKVVVAAGGGWNCERGAERFGTGDTCGGDNWQAGVVSNRHGQ